MLKPSNRISLALLVLAPLLLFADVVAGARVFFQGDLLAYHLPLKWAWADVVSSGSFPWWNPWIGGGQPMAANPAYQSFYPLQLPLLLPGFAYWFQLHIIVHVIIGGTGMYLLLRELDRSIYASFLCALAFEMSGPFLGTLGRIPFLFSMAWIPWVLLFTRRFVTGRRVGDGAIAALFLGLQALVGEPVTLLQTAILMTGYAAAHGWGEERSAASALRSSLRVIAVGICAIALAAVQLVPAVGHARDSVRSDGFEWRVASNWSTPVARLGDIVYPDLQRARADEEGFQRMSSLYPFRTDSYLATPYPGLLILLAACAGFGSRLMRHRVAMGSAIVLLTALALGEALPLFRAGWSIGVFSSIRYPEKFLLGATMLLFIAAAFGLDRIAREPRARTAVMWLAIAWLIVGALIAAGGSGGGALPSTSLAADLELAALPWTPYWIANLVRGAGVIALLLMARTRAPLAVALSVPFVVGDLMFVAQRHAARIDAGFLSRPAVAEKVDDGRRIFNAAAWQDYERNVPQAAFATNSWRITRNALYPFRNVSFGIASVHEEDIDETTLATSDALTGAMIGARQRMGRWPEGLLASSGVGSIIRFDADLRTEEVGQANPDFDPVTVQMLPGRTFWFAERVTEIDDVRDLVDSVAREGDVPFTAFIQSSGVQVNAGGTIDGVVKSPARIDVDVTAAGRSLFVAAVTNHSGWSMTVDGAPVEAIPVSLAWQGVPLGEGKHKVVMTYRNATVIWSGLVSLGVLLFLGIAAWRGDEWLSSARAGSTLPPTASGQRR